LFLSAVIKAVDDYSDLIRVSAANPGNDHRLGANEAPPAIVSMFLGEQLTDILEQIENGEATSSKQGGLLKIGVSTLPALPKDSTDRNRTSPFAFTGNKFEFRMVPSSASISDANVVINTAVAEILNQISARLEKAEDFNSEVQNIIREIVVNHKRIIFNGDGYSEEWVKEAEKRGLKNLKSTVEAAPALISDKAIELFGKYKVLSSVELHSRYEILLEAYIKQTNIEALTMLEMAKRDIAPAAIKYTKQLAESINMVKQTGIYADVSAQQDILCEISTSLSQFRKDIVELQKVLADAQEIKEDNYNQGLVYRYKVVEAMNNLRYNGDKLESLTDASLWPFPTYGQLLFYVY
jgi:glutamine synthetase